MLVAAMPKTTSAHFAELTLQLAELLQLVGINGCINGQITRSYGACGETGDQTYGGGG